MLQDYYTLIIGGDDGSTTDRVEVVSLNPTSNGTNCRKDVGNIPTPIKGAVGTTFGKLMRVVRTNVRRSDKIKFMNWWKHISINSYLSLYR